VISSNPSVSLAQEDEKCDWTQSKEKAAALAMTLWILVKSLLTI